MTFDTIWDGAKRRRERIKAIERFIQKNSGIPISDCISQLEYSTGLTEDRLRSYLTILQKAGKIYEKGMKVYAKKET